ncbi:hypothetical protein [Paraburkholderia sp. 2C]
MNINQFATTQILSVAFFLSVSTCKASTDRISFSTGATLVFSSSLTSEERKKFGTGWKTAIYSNMNGQQFNLFPLETLTSSNGILFDDSYPPQISPTGKYAVIDVVRVGILQAGPSEKAEVQSRQYCPVLETTTGCIVSNETGELCGGVWDKRKDRWIVRGLEYDTNTPMLQYQFKTANILWSEYASTRNKPFHPSIRNLIFSNLGITNLMACDPPGADNIASYKNIQIELERAGDIENSHYILQKLQIPGPPGGK